MAEKGRLEITVKLFALLRNYAPSGSGGNVFRWCLREGETVADLLTELRIPPELAQLVLVNGRHSEVTTRLLEDDVVSLFPALAGGVGWREGWLSNR